MAEKILFELVSPAKLLSSRAVDMVVVPGAEGDFGALPRHSPLISAVRPGVIAVYEDGKITDRIFVDGGFSEVTAERVTVLAEEAFPLSEATKDGANARTEAAKALLAAAKTDLERQIAEHKVAAAAALQAAL